MTRTKDLNYYLSLPYTIEIVRTDESTWFARVMELPGCITEGDSGRFVVRVPKSLHRDLVETAAREGVSLNLEGNS